MKRILLVTTLINLLVLPVISLAIETIPPGPSTPEELIGIIDRIANWVFAILLAAAVIFIVIAGYQFLTSGGDPARVASARNSLLYALIGIAVGFLAKAFVTLVRLALGL